MQEERPSFHASTQPNVNKVIQKYISFVQFEVRKKIMLYQNEKRLSIVDKIISYKGNLCKKGESGKYEIGNILLYQFIKVGWTVPVPVNKVALN